MSVIDLQAPGGSTTSGYGRTPPQDVAAEQSVLGGMMLSKDAIADVVEVLRGNDFYRPAHELVYDSVLDLYGRGEPADAVTVSAELTKRGELGRAGGPAYLHTLISSVPTAANAGYYARIVRERAVLRRLVEAGTKIVQLGYATDGGDVDEIVNAAQAEVYSVTERRTSEDFLPLSEIIEGTIDEIEASSHRGDGMVGIPTGFADLDRLTNGLHPGQMIVIAARPAVGKALALDTPLPTPDGWTTMGEVAVGHLLLGADGRPTRVLAATEVMHERRCHEVHFSDGSVIVADAEHQWLTETPGSAQVRTTEQIAATLRCPTAGRRPNHSVANARPVRLPPRDLPVSPYTLGAWLGGGTGAAAQITSPDHGNIPTEYLRASEAQRRDLLAGLLDPAGTVSPSGVVQLSVSSRRLALGVQELLSSLGCGSSISSKAGRGRSAMSRPAFTLAFSTDDDVFGEEHKRLLHKQRRASAPRRHDSRFITDVRPLPSVPMRCVMVDSDDHLYLAGRAMIPTHNSTVGLDICRAAAIHHGQPAVIFSLEMSRNEITMRLLSAEARIPLQNMRKGTMREEDWTRLARTMGEVSEAPLFVDDSPNMSLMEIRAKCRRLKQRHGLRLVVVDYLQLMTSGRRVESRQQEVSEFSRALKLLAKELEVPVIAISQLNRGPEQRTDKKPLMSDLRESGCLTADTRVLRADTGAETTMGELYAAGARDVPVWSLDSSLRYVRRHLTHVFPTGRKAVYRLQLASGKQIRATANHPFLTYDGWKPLAALAVGSRLAVPRHVPAPEQVLECSDDEVVLAAHLLGDGSFGVHPVPRLDARDPSGRHCHEPFVPGEVFRLPKRQIVLFLRHLWSTGGSVTPVQSGRDRRICYASSSRRLLADVARLLLRFGISARVRPTTGAGHTLDICGCDDQRRFMAEIGVHGARGETAVRPPGVVRGPTADSSADPSVDTVPAQVWDGLREVLAAGAGSDREVVTVTGTRVGGTKVKRVPSRQRMAGVASVLDDADLELLAVNDVLWDTIVAIEPGGERDVFDATVAGNHNFIANGIAVHNSIEQDADMVILLHREDMYEKESPRAGEADFIVAKHRNGPTDTITVAFQGHYSRFVDMAS